MKRSSLTSLLAVAMLTGFVGKAQTADDIINKYIDAIGGKEKLAAIKTVYIESDFEIMGNQSSSITHIVNGKAYRSDVDFGGQKIIQCITDTSGWMINPMAGSADATPLPEDQVKLSQSQLHVGGGLVDYAAQGDSVTLEGQEDLNGVQAYKLVLKTPAGAETTFYIDPTTYYILKSVTKATVNGQDVETSVVYSDQQKTDFGYVMPFTTEVTTPQGYVITIKHKKVEFNKDIDPSLFAMPTQ